MQRLANVTDKMGCGCVVIHLRIWWSQVCHLLMKSRACWICVGSVLQYGFVRVPSNSNWMGGWLNWNGHTDWCVSGWAVSSHHRTLNNVATNWNVNGPSCRVHVCPHPSSVSLEGQQIVQALVSPSWWGQHLLLRWQRWWVDVCLFGSMRLSGVRSIEEGHNWHTSSVSGCGLIHTQSRNRDWPSMGAMGSEPKGMAWQFSRAISSGTESASTGKGRKIEMRNWCCVTTCCTSSWTWKKKNTQAVFVRLFVCLFVWSDWGPEQHRHWHVS